MPDKNNNPGTLLMKPVLVFVYNRPSHTREMLKALALNEGADKTHVIIYSDGSKSETDKVWVAKVRQECKQASGFFRLTLIERDRNYGLAENIISGVSQEIEKYGAVIVLEDDLVTSPGFLKYMNAALEFYRNTNIFSICGYSPQLKIPSEYKYSTYLAQRIGSWGWASWEEKWKKVDWEVTDFYHFIGSPRERKRFEAGGNDLSMMLLKQKLNKINSWAIRFSYSCFKLDYRVVYPVKSLVRNAGIDGSGTHMKKTKKYKSIVTDKVESSYFCPPTLENVTIQKRFREFYSTSLVRRALNILKFNRFLIMKGFQMDTT